MMDELEKGLAVALNGPAAAAAAREARRQASLWGLALPDVEPLALDFGLGDFPRTGEVEFWIANETEAGYCGKLLYVREGQTCPSHRHGRKHETFFIVKGRVRMVHGGVEREMAAGETLAMPPGRLHSFTGLEPSLLLEVSMPGIVDDNWFEDGRIPIGGHYKGDGGKGTSIR